jgi:nucleoside-diphosphate-sugar epimerase
MNLDSEQTVAITGASGYLGSVIRQRVTDAGCRVVSLVRKAADDGCRRFVISEDPEPGLLAGVDVLIHCAYDMSLRDRSAIWRVNVDGTRRLLELAAKSRVQRTIVLSSMSAYQGTTQLYGLSKLAIEDDAKRFGAVSVRPGLVYGSRAGGMAGTLSALTALPIVPVVASRSYQFTVHEDDLAEAIVALAAADAASSDPIGVANPVPVLFRQVIDGLARQQGRRCRMLPIDWRLLHRALKICEDLGMDLPFRADSLLGLANPAPFVPNLAVLDALGVSLRRFSQPVPHTPRNVVEDHLRLSRDSSEDG